jgi:antagonist of KipI
MRIKIIKPGVQTTLQDGGRHGFRSIGIGTSGAMDIFAMIVSNFLVANNEDAAVLEINFPGPEIQFTENAMISLTGADLSATVDDTAVPSWKPFFIKKDAVLKFKQPGLGAKAYLAIKGGWRADKWLGSYSTHLKAAVGGYSGRSLQKDDEVFFNEKDQPMIPGKIMIWHLSLHEIAKVYEPHNSIRCIAGIEWDLLDKTSKEKFTSGECMISNQSDRMGYRLSGSPLSLQEKITELISSAVDAGTIQLLPDGNLIVLMADHQTTGGYPRIASVIKADLPKLAQCTAGQSIYFKMITLKEAEEVLISMMQSLAEIKASCHLNFTKYFGA